MKQRLFSIAMAVLILLSAVSLNTFADKKSNNNNYFIMEQIDSQASEPDSSFEESSTVDENQISNQPIFEKETGEVELEKSTDGSTAEKEKWLNYLADNGLEPYTEEEMDNSPDDNGIQTLYFDLADDEDILFAQANVISTNDKNPKPEIKKRYTVLVLDVSGSMEGTPLYKMKIACQKFIEKVMTDTAENYVAIVPYSTNLKTITPFTSDKNVLKSAINKLNDYSMTNINVGLEKADELLGAIADEEGLIKNIILLSDGLPNEGKTNPKGRYGYDEYSSFEYANASYDTAKSIHSKKTRLYTLGFFHSLYNEDLAFGRRFMNDLQNAGYYDVDDPNDLEFVFGDIANEEDVIIGKFKYPGAAGPKDYEQTFIFKNSYFFNSSYLYNRELATMSFCLELASFASSDEKSYINKSINARNLFADLGFSNFSVNDFYNFKPTTDSIGVVAASKQIKVKNTDYTLIAIAVRGGGYESEWAGNFTIGENGNHKGFEDAKNHVADFLKQYIYKNKIKGNIKLWITGYSRGGGVANLLAGALNNKSISLSPCILEPSNMYTYTFEAPQGTIDSEAKNQLHSNIFNFMNYSDPVPHVAPAYWDFKHYGIVKYVPQKFFSNPIEFVKNMARMKAILKSYDSFSGKEYKLDQFQMKKIGLKGPVPTFTVGIVNDNNSKFGQGEFLKHYIDTLTKEFLGTRNFYVTSYQDHIRNILKIIYEAEPDKVGSFIEILTKKWQDESKIGLLFLLIFSPDNDIAVYERLSELVDESLQEAGIINYNKNKLKTTIVGLADLIVAMSANHPNLTATLVLNSESIIQAHYPEICLAWLQAMDKNYTSDEVVEFSRGKTRIIKINCPVDVDIYQEDELIAQIINEEAVEIGDYMVSFGINDDGEKFAYLSAEGNYKIDIHARGEGSVNYTVIEESMEDGISRITNYFDVPITKGTKLTAELPKFTRSELDNPKGEASLRTYTLSNMSEGKELTATNNLTDDEAKNSYCSIEAVSEDNNKGLAWGSGNRILGGYAIVRALPMQGYLFEGWYEAGNKVSQDVEYRLRADKDRRLTAKFKQDPQGQNKNDSSEDGTQYQNDYASYTQPDTEKIEEENTPKDNLENNITKKHAPFIDIENHWARDSIDNLWNRMMIKGYSDNTFRPDKEVTRSEIVEFVINVKQLEKIPYYNIFSDVKFEDWFSSSLATAAKNEIVQGYPDKSFKPKQTMTRAEWATVLYNIQGRPKMSLTQIDKILAPFTDKEAIPSWAKSAFAYNVKVGVFKGYEGKLNSEEAILRAEIVATLQRMLNNQQ